MLPLIHQVANGLFEGLRTILGPMGFVVGTGLIGMMLWSLFSATRDTVAIAKQMHEVPCPNCQYYTGDHRLKCPVHPAKAASEQAIDCQDYRALPRI